MKHRAEVDIRTFAARFGQNEIICQHGLTGKCYLPLTAIAALPNAGPDIEVLCRAVRFASTWIEEGHIDPITHIALRDSLRLDDQSLRRLGRILQLERFVFSEGGASSGDMSTFSVGPSARALFFDRIRDFSDYQATVSRVSEMERERWRLEATERQGTPRPIDDFYFPANEQFRARQRLYEVLLSARDNVLIIDPHLDPTVLDFVDSLDPPTTVRLLTGKPKPLFVQQLRLLQARREGVEARSPAPSHDRWVILDGTTIWHLGASINGLGKTASRISRMPEGGESSRLLDDSAKWWTEAAPL